METKRDARRKEIYMTAAGDNPKVHRIVDGRFVCSAPAEARCRQYPDCGCEVCTEELHGDTPAPGHEPKPQPDCWMEPWVNATDLHECYGHNSAEFQFYGWTFPDGPVTCEFHGDYLTWQYADDTKPFDPEADTGDLDYFDPSAVSS